MGLGHADPGRPCGPERLGDPGGVGGKWPDVDQVPAAGSTVGMLDPLLRPADREMSHATFLVRGQEDEPAEAGWSVASPWSGGQRVVITAAQTLLSEEQKAQIHISH
jgi:hypothetical protein